MNLTSNKRIIISQSDFIHLISPEQIVYCKADNCYTYVYTIEGEQHLVVMSLAKFSKELTPEFIRVNQSFLVNRAYIRNINRKKKAIELVNKSVVPFTITIKSLLILLKG